MDRIIRKWFKYIDDKKWHDVVMIEKKEVTEFYIDGKLIGIDDRK